MFHCLQACFDRLSDPSESVFFDPNQNLYVQEPCLPEEFGQPYLLQENCRNTVRIATHCASLLGHEPKSRHGAPTGG